jgi:hypothetical protein
MGARRATRGTRVETATATIDEVPKASKRAKATKAAATKTPKTKATKARSAKASSRRATAGAKAARPTLASIAAQLAALSEQVASIFELLTRERSEPASSASANGVARGEDGASEASADCTPETFETDLVSLVRQLDRSGRHGGLVPIPELRDVFLKRGWTRRSFDERLLQAERDFVVDLKAANDPTRLAAPDLAIVDTGRGHLQYVVLR